MARTAARAIYVATFIESMGAYQVSMEIYLSNADAPYECLFWMPPGVEFDKLVASIKEDRDLIRIVNPPEMTKVN